MAKERKDNDENGKASVPVPQAVSEKRQPRCLQIAAQGIQTSAEFAKLMSALMSDVIEGTITPVVSNAAVNAGGKLLKVVELQMKYGTSSDDGGKSLKLCGTTTPQKLEVRQEQIRRHFQAMREELERQETTAMQEPVSV